MICLYDYNIFKDYEISYKTFIDFNGPYLKIPVEKVSLVLNISLNNLIYIKNGLMLSLFIYNISKYCPN